MALTQVRARFNGTWYTLTYNASTGRYETKIKANETSFHQPGGYFSLAAEATNQSGDKAEIDGSILPGLRLVVQETNAPTLRLVSPAPGWLNTSNPVFVFEATDEAGGSGVNPDSFSPAGATVEAIPGGYRFTWSEHGWTDGPHTLTASVSDYDGNDSNASGAWVVDTIPPELTLKTPYMRHIVDDESVLVSGTALDLNGVDVLVNGVSADIDNGVFFADVPLVVGHQYIIVTARDPAGLETTETIYMIRMITDRTAADVEKIKALQEKGPFETWAEDEKIWYTNGVIKGAYNVSDMNRVGAAVELLESLLRQRGYDPSVSPKTDWIRSDVPASTQGETYRKNVETIRDAQPVSRIQTLPLPFTLRNLNQDGANQLEKALVEADAVLPNYFAWTAGEVTAGGF